jgi:hypothetical protein
MFSPKMSGRALAISASARGMAEDSASSSRVSNIYFSWTVRVRDVLFMTLLVLSLVGFINRKKEKLINRCT